MMLLLTLIILCQRFTPAACYNVQREGVYYRAETLRERKGRRRNFIVGLGTALVRYPAIRANADEQYQRITSVEEVADYIQRFCNSEFLTSVLDARCSFLYRGLAPDQSEAVTSNNGLAAVVVKDEPYDLLDPKTYGSNDAASYFSSLEEEMISMRPSNSHIGTTCPKEAAQWGFAASIWPLGEKGVNFAWIEDGGVFWPVEDAKQGTKRKIVTTQSYGTKKGALAEALQGDAWEIMFRADNGFLAVPAMMDVYYAHTSKGLRYLQDKGDN